MKEPFVVSEYDFYIPIDKMLKFALVTDLHNGDGAAVLKTILQNHVDAILIAGDFIHDERRYEQGIDFLKRCAAVLPTFCSLGNHEARFKEKNIRLLVKNSGTTLLDNEDTLFCGVRIGGLTGLSEKQTAKGETPNLAFLKEFSQKDGYKILLCHQPEHYDKYVRKYPIQLTLSGHAHGGQWRFFGRGVYAPGQGLFPKFTSGLYEGKLLVSRGLANPQKIPKIGNREVLILLNFYSVQY